MISRKAAFSILLGIAGVLIMTWRMSILPGRVVIINQSGAPISHVALAADDYRVELGAIGNGETRRVAIRPTRSLRLSFRTADSHVWSSPKGLSAGQSIVLYVVPGEQVIARDRIGTFAR